MSAAVVVVIGAANLRPGLRERLADQGQLLTFADTEPIPALQAILERRPQLIVLERLFAVTSRGAALMNRIKSDPEIGRAELRVVSHTSDGGDAYRPGSETPGAPEVPPMLLEQDFAAVPLATTAAPDLPNQIDWHGTRRAGRYPLQSGVEIHVDGNPVVIVDMSAVGAQVISATILRPNQRVRISVPTDDFVMRFRATVAWAKFELPTPPQPPRYRAGLEFVDADRAAMESYCVRHKA
jgi:CheY-like chemotaxis protein